MKETDKAYIAGLLDGEAYIGIKRNTTLRNGRINPGYQERIQVRMVDEQVIKFLAEILGGSYHKQKPSAVNGRPLYCFHASDKMAVNILRTILPYLRVKRTVAEAVLKLRDLKDNPHKESTIIEMKNRWGQITKFKRWHYSPAHIETCQQLWQACKDLNRVGI